MGYPNISKALQSLPYMIMSMAVAGSLGASVALNVSQADEQLQGWTQCFVTIESAIALGTDVDEALVAVRSERSENQRQLDAHQRALGQLTTDWRWEDPEQREWLEGASQGTQAQIDGLEELDEEAGGTEGCLQQF